jgi:hypothetical protein
MSNPLALDWNRAIRRYAACVRRDGSPEGRASTWAQANQALDRLLEQEWAERKARAGHDTEELEAA